MTAKTTEKTETTASKTAASTTEPLYKGPIDIVKHRGVYLLVTLALVVPAIIFIVMSMVTTDYKTPVKLGIDFTGGTMLEYAFKQQVTLDDLPKIQTIFEEKGYPNPVVQISEIREGDLSGGGEGLKLGWQPNDPAPSQSVAASNTKPSEAKEPQTAGNQKAQASDQVVEETKTAEPAESGAYTTKVSIRTKQLEPGHHRELEAGLQQAFGELTLLQKNSIGPTLAGELLVNASLALLLAYLLIVGYLTIRFQFDYAVCAIIALVHDTLFVFGVFAALGMYMGVEVDSMFVTGILTVVGFSVHDTIVVFDRLRENVRLYYSKKLPFGEIANMSLNQTLARSINTSLTALLTLFALYFLGGETTRWFVFTLIIGIMTGTFSSICVASMLLTWWRDQGTNSPKLAV